MHIVKEYFSGTARENIIIIILRKTNGKTNMKKMIESYIETNFQKFCDLNDLIWEFAETKFEEFQSAEAQIAILEKEEMRITRNVCGMKTAFTAEFGNGSPVIAILGEFDALPELHQEAGNFEKTETGIGKNGHGCGHNTLGAAAALAAAAVKDCLKENNLSGTVRYYGCPAEEGGAGKSFMVREGAFDDVDIALTWHPNYFNSVVRSGSLANIRVFYKFCGTSAHAAAAPHLGRSALDAVELMNIGVNYLREHIIPEARIHYAITNAGGNVPNVVQKEAEVLYAIRAPKLWQLDEICQRVDKVAKGASLMTETESHKRIVSGYADFISNKTISKIICENFLSTPPVVYTQEEMEFSQNFKDTLPSTELLRILDELIQTEDSLEKIKEIKNDVLQNSISQFFYPPTPMFGSTDVGDVSHVVPTGQFFATCYAMGTPSHSWQVVSQGKSSIAHKGLRTAAGILAKTAADFLQNPDLCKEAKREFQESEITYESPLPREVKPGLWKE